MQVELSETEKEALVELVRNALADIGPEIHHTVDHDYREELRQRRVLLEGLLTHLGASLQPSK